jgi:hypothetical protein
MKYLLSIAIFCFALVSNAQKKEITIQENKVGGVTCLYGQTIDLDKADTLSYVYFKFQNKRYDYVTDNKVIFFVLPQEKDALNEFLKDIKAAKAELGSDAKLSWEKDKYSVSIENTPYGGFFIYGSLLKKGVVIHL